MSQRSPKPASAVEQPDGSVAVAESVPPTKDVLLRVTPSLTVPSTALPTVPLGRRLDQLAISSAGDGDGDPMALMMAWRSGATAPGRERPSAGLVDDGGKLPHDPDEQVLAEGHPHGFISAAIAAFSQHYPIALRPQHFWLMILQAVATHVDLHAEQLRSKWVAHEGKKELVVRRDHFVLGQPNDWAGVIAGPPDSFASQIQANVVEGVFAQLSPEFTDTTVAESIAGAVTVMDIAKNYFSYKCMTCCGFPSVTLEGTLDDWQRLRAHAATLIRQRCTKEFSEEWCRALLPVLDKLVEEYKAGATAPGSRSWVSRAAPDEKFWNSMVKRGGTSGSGARTWFSGWVNVFFPYIERSPNRWCVAYSPTNGYVKEGRDGGHYGMFDAPKGVDGPDCADFPKGLAEAPVTWQYHGSDLKLKFKAGFIGATQDPQTMVVRPKVGWFIVR